ncbi:MAG: hypothetical protein RIS64_1973 [Bacteroidota bacterium]|jgi:hypothetical protein
MNFRHREHNNLSRMTPIFTNNLVRIGVIRDKMVGILLLYLQDFEPIENFPVFRSKTKVIFV